MKKSLIKICATVFVLSLFSCKMEEQNEDKVKTIEKDGSIEVKLSVKHLTDKKDLFLVNRIVWLKGKKYCEVLGCDTIPSLGKEAQIVQKTITDSDGYDMDVDTCITVPKNYQLFITVK